MPTINGEEITTDTDANGVETYQGQRSPARRITCFPTRASPTWASAPQIASPILPEG